MENQFVMNVDKWSIDDDGLLNFLSDQIQDTKLDVFAPRSTTLPFTDFGVGIQQPKLQTFIVHNGHVYINAASIESAVIKHS